MIHLVASEGHKIMDKRNGRKYSEVYCTEAEAHFYVEVEA